MLTLTKKKRDLIAEQARQELARRSLEQFMIYDGRGSWKTAPHLQLLCKQIEDVERKTREGAGKRLMIFMPPRHGKSEVSTKKAPAWILARNPSFEMIISSYSSDLSYDFSKIARQTFREHAHLFGADVSRDSGAIGRWGIEGHRGGLAAAGVGGPLTGRGAHIAIIDDPIKNYEEASSATVRENVYNWYKSTLRTRLAPGGSIILIMTRWHEDDLAGRLLREMKDGEGEQWDVLSLPAQAEGVEDALGREKGEWLWPTRFAETEMEKTKKAVGSYLFNAMYQQRPRPLGGLLFKTEYFRYFKQENGLYILGMGDGQQRRYGYNQLTVFQTCDPAGSTKKTADYFALGTWALAPRGELLLLDVIRTRIEGPDQPGLLMNAFSRWNPVLQGVEPKNMGLTLFQTMQRQGVPLVELKADTDKYTRAIPIAARYETGDVYHPENAPWLDDFERELVSFPNAENDDQVDMTSYAAVVQARIEELVMQGQANEYDEHEEMEGISPY